MYSTCPWTIVLSMDNRIIQRWSYPSVMRNSGRNISGQVQNATSVIFIIPWDNSVPVRQDCKRDKQEIKCLTPSRTHFGGESRSCVGNIPLKRREGGGGSGSLQAGQLTLTVLMQPRTALKPEVLTDYIFHWGVLSRPSFAGISVLFRPETDLRSE